MATRDYPTRPEFDRSPVEEVRARKPAGDMGLGSREYSFRGLRDQHAAVARNIPLPRSKGGDPLRRSG
jgi:hypothetical protein